MSKALVTISDATEATVEQAYSRFVDREPVVVAGLVTAPIAWLIANIGAILVGHTHLFTDKQWGAVATYVTPIASGFVIGVVTWLVVRFLRNLVAPAWKLLTGRTLPDLASVGSTETATSGFVATVSPDPVKAIAAAPAPDGSADSDAVEPDDTLDDLADDSPDDEITGTSTSTAHDPNTPGASRPPATAAV